MSFCFYHNDMDGKCAGAIVNQAFPGIELRSIQYGQSFPFDEVYEKFVYMVDFCLQPFELMEELNGICELVWIDHHKSAVEEAQKRGFLCAGQLLRVGDAGCELAWEYFFPSNPLPRAVHLLGRYDVWDHTDPDALPFQYAMRTLSLPPSAHGWWECLFEVDDLSTLIRDGQTMIMYAENYDAEYAHAAFETRLDGLHGVAINRLYNNSKAFDTVYDPNKHDVMISFGWRDKQWTVSLYATKADIDVAKLAKRYGGGGHRGAAGFQCAVLPFELQ